jgi:hypothetical protein
MTSGTSCAWTASSTNSWLHTTSSGSGNGTINYAFDANNTPAPRTGYISAGGQTTAITQAAPPNAIAVALGATNLLFQTGSPYPWFTTNPPAPTFDGRYSAVSGNRLVPSSASWLQTTLVGPGTLSFWWRVDSDVTPPPPAVPTSFDELEVDINGAMQDQIMGQVDWNYRSYFIPPGTNVVTWQYVKDATFNGGMDQGWLDQVTYTTAAPVPLYQALDTCGMNWTSGGNTNPTTWYGQTNITHSSPSAAQSGAIASGQQSWLQSTVAGVTNLSFWWKVSCQTNYDYLEFYTNSVLATRITGEADWRSNFFRLPATTNQLKWRFFRTNVIVVAQGQMAGWLDKVVVNPPPRPQIVSFATNVVLTTAATNCQGFLPDLTSPGYLTLPDNCAVVLTQSPAAGTALSPGASHVVVTVQNSTGGSTSVTNNTLVVDATPPVLTLLGPDPLTLECHAALVDPGVVASDNCSGVVALSTNSFVNSQAVGAYSIQYVATDAAGNAATNSRTVYVLDTQPPVVSLLGADPLVVQCHGPFADPGALASDDCAGSLPVTVTGAVDPTVPGIYTLTYTAVDPSGNSASASRTVSVVDTLPPVITLNGANPLIVECHGSFTDPGAVALDACAGPLPVNVTGSVNASVPGRYTLTYSAVDPAGNPAAVSRTVTVVDTQPPVINLNGANPLVVECHTTFTDPGAVATDDCAGPVPVSVNGAVNPNSPGTYTLTYSAVDPSGNSASASRTVSVVDTKPPVITLNGANPLAVECHSAFTDPGAVASDDCAGPVPVTVSGTVDPTTPGLYTLTYTAVDPAGNSATNSRTVSVVDTRPPVVTLVGTNTLVVECHSSFSEPGATAFDECAGPLPVTVTGNVNPNVPGLYTLIYTAVDPAGNSATNSLTVSVVDTRPPVVTLNGSAVLSVECHSLFTDPGAAAVDDCADSLPVTVTGLVDTSVLGTYTLTYSAVDPSGNSASVSRTVHVVDTTPPQITAGLPTQTFAAGSNCTAVLPDLSLLIGATDNCSSGLNHSQTPAPGTVLALGTNSVTFFVDDGNGNTNTSSTLVIVADQTPPVITAQPLGHTNRVGDQVVFSVAAASCSALTYQWYHNSQPISGETNVTLTLPSVTSADAGSYLAVVASPVGSMLTDPAQLTVTNLALVPPTILTSGLLDSGTYALTFSGPAGQTFRVLATADISAPLSSWSVLTNGTFATDPITVTQPTAGFPVRFFSVASP